MQSREELIHASVFADFLQMADYLVDSGYKDAGAVIAGSTLEGAFTKDRNEKQYSSINRGTGEECC